MRFRCSFGLDSTAIHSLRESDIKSSPVCALPNAFAVGSSRRRATNDSHHGALHGPLSDRRAGYAANSWYTGMPAAPTPTPHHHWNHRVHTHLLIRFHPLYAPDMAPAMAAVVSTSPPTRICTATTKPPNQNANDEVGGGPAGGTRACSKPTYGSSDGLPVVFWGSQKTVQCPADSASDISAYWPCSRGRLLGLQSAHAGTSDSQLVRPQRCMHKSCQHRPCLVV